MVEEEEDSGKAKNRPTPIKNRGFYVRMRFLQSNNNNNNKQHGNKSQPLQHLQCNSSSSSNSSHDGITGYLILLFRSNYRCFKWFLLWFFISLYYFFTFPFLLPPSDGNNINNESSSGPPLISMPKTTAFSHLISSRALSESTVDSSFKATTNRSTATPLLRHQPSSSVNEVDSPNDLKIYIYELPSKYNKDWLVNDRCSSHLFASEVAIHRALSNSRFRTLDPYEADLFFVPVYVSCNFSTTNGFPAIGHARSLIYSAVQHISAAFPFWNMSGGGSGSGSGSDHVFVASHDFGACFHTMEDVAIADGITETLKGSVILQTFGVTYRHPCQLVGNSSVVIPPYIPPAHVRSTLKKFPLDGRRRDIFAFFRGKMELHPKNVSGRFYSKAVRTKIWNELNRDRRFYLRRRRYAGYQSEIARSIFCLCPLGWAPWSPRIVESVVLGCVPVIIADDIRLPFSDRVPWKDISLTVPEHDVEKLGQILDQVARTNLSAIQANIWDRPDVRTALLFHVPMKDGDATWQVVSELWGKVVRRSRRS